MADGIFERYKNKLEEKVTILYLGMAAIRRIAWLVESADLMLEARKLWWRSIEWFLDERRIWKLHGVVEESLWSLSEWRLGGALRNLNIENALGVISVEYQLLCSLVGSDWLSTFQFSYKFNQNSFSFALERLIYRSNVVQRSFGLNLIRL